MTVVELTPEQRESLRASAQAVCRGIMEAMRPVVEAVTRLREELLPAAWAEYDQDGRPLGDAEADMWRWLNWKRQLEDALPEKFPLTDDEEDAWDAIVYELDQD